MQPPLTRRFPFARPLRAVHRWLSGHVHFALLLAISFAMFNVGYVIDQTIRWSDHLEGFGNGVFHVLVFGIVWCVYLLPWSLAVAAVYRWRKWSRFRSVWVLAPAVLWLAAMLAALIVDPPTDAGRFRKLAGTKLPADVRIFYRHFSGGGLADYTDIWYFETSPAEVDRLVAEMHLEERSSGSSLPLRLPGSPDDAVWRNARSFGRDSGAWFWSLVASEDKTRVYLVIGCI